MPYVDVHLGHAPTEPNPDPPTEQILYKQASNIPLTFNETTLWYEPNQNRHQTNKLAEQFDLLEKLLDTAELPVPQHHLASAVEHTTAAHTLIAAATAALPTDDPTALIPRTAALRHHIDQAYEHLRTGIDAIFRALHLTKKVTTTQNATAFRRNFERSFAGNEADIDHTFKPFRRITNLSNLLDAQYAGLTRNIKRIRTAKTRKGSKARLRTIALLHHRIEAIHQDLIDAAADYDIERQQDNDLRDIELNHAQKTPTLDRNTGRPITTPTPSHTSLRQNSATAAANILGRKPTWTGADTKNSLSHHAERLLR
jgi:hypothetical protein